MDELKKIILDGTSEEAELLSMFCGVESEPKDKVKYEYAAPEGDDFWSSNYLLIVCC